MLRASSPTGECPWTEAARVGLETDQPPVFGKERFSPQYAMQMGFYGYC